MTPGDFERNEQEKLITDRMARVERKILVMSGKGGVGKGSERIRYEPGRDCGAVCVFGPFEHRVHGYDAG